MRAVRDLLQNADPLPHEPHPREAERNRLRQVVVAAASDIAATPPARMRSSVALAATVALILVGIVTIGSQMWSQGGSTLQAAIRFEVRLAEDRPAAGLREARIAGSNRVVHLHPEAIVTNSDIAESRTVPGDGPSRFGVHVQLNEAGAEKMRRATAGHVGRPVAILIDGKVVAAPVLTGPISTDAVISGDYTKAEAERIVHGIGLR